MSTVKSAINIVRLPKKERDKILVVAAKKAEREYLSNAALTSFEVLAEDDLYDEAM